VCAARGPGVGDPLDPKVPSKEIRDHTTDCAVLIKQALEAGSIESEPTMQCESLVSITYRVHGSLPGKARGGFLAEVKAHGELF
jgi:hypothetical protein